MKKSIVEILSFLFDKIINRLVILLLLSILVLTLADVFNRFILRRSIPWAMALNRSLFVWLVFLGIGVGIKRKEHFKITDLLEKLPDKIENIVKIFVYIFSIILFIVFIYTLTILPETVGFRIDSVTRIPTIYFYLSVPVGSVVAILALIHNFLEEII